jgi:hypothetical protein
MISQMVRNESVIFGRHIDIEVSYKILWLKVPKLVPILHYLAYFQKGLFGGNFEQKHPFAFRGYNRIQRTPILPLSKLQTTIKYTQMLLKIMVCEL